ncbi:Protein kinase domain [Carpediemonas membranifera]|uniref:Protein kinase domain n=1 Tax=Carpediemonas membranifera TaxID=201153 RepID=A0A8J6E1B0_9EUKA|nr:Protein kinase domain [Carpediemonas membranifera]|eukprot:KAG9393248.1 Protein kinase domain [Carpediemonas membranifera]
MRRALTITLLFAYALCFVDFNSSSIELIPRQTDQHNFGAEVAMSRNLLAIASQPYKDNGNTINAYVMLYTNLSTSWEPLGKLVVPSADAHDLAAPQVVLNGQYVAIGTSFVSFGTVSDGIWTYDSTRIEGCTKHKAQVLDGRVYVACLSDPKPVHVFFIDDDAHTLNATGLVSNDDAVGMLASDDCSFIGIVTAAGPDWAVKTFHFSSDTDSYVLDGVLKAPSPSSGRHFMDFAIAPDTVFVTDMTDDGDGYLTAFKYKDATTGWVHVLSRAPQLDPDHSNLHFVRPGLKVAACHAKWDWVFVNIIGAELSGTYAFYYTPATGPYLLLLQYHGHLPGMPRQTVLTTEHMVQTYQTSAGNVTAVMSLRFSNLARAGGGWSILNIGEITSVSTQYSRFGNFVRAYGATALIGAPGDAQARIFGTSFMIHVDSSGAETLQRLDTVTNTIMNKVGTRSAISQDLMAVSAPGAVGDVGVVVFFINIDGVFEPVFDWQTGVPSVLMASGGSVLFGSHVLEMQLDDTRTGIVLVGSESNKLFVFPITKGVCRMGSVSLSPTGTSSSSIFFFGTDADLVDRRLIVGAVSGSFFTTELQDDWTAGPWTQTARPDEGIGLFGYYVSLSDDGQEAAVSYSAPTETGKCTVAAIYSPGPDAWVVQTLLQVDAGAAGCGVSRTIVGLDYHGDTVTVGLGMAENGGVVHRFQRLSAGQWQWKAAFNARHPITTFSVSEGVLIVSSGSYGVQAFVPNEPLPNKLGLYLAIAGVSVAMMLAASCATGVCCVQLAGSVVVVFLGVTGLKRLRAAIVRQRLRKFAKAELTKLGVDSSNKLYSAIWDFFIPPDMVTETEVIAAGGFGSVSRAVYKDQVVCIKKLHEAFQADATSMNEFAREAKTLVELSHPNVLKFLGATVRLPAIYIVTELCALGSLTGYVEKKRKRGELTSEDLLDLVIEAADGLAFIHSRGIVHRDIKPDNFFVSVEEKVRKNRIRVKVGDLGLAVNNTTKTMTNIGTIGFAAPELLQRGDYDQKADVFSFAMTIYALFAEELPFAQESSFTAMKMINDGVRPEPLGPLRDQHALQRIIEAMWAQSPQDRPTMRTALKMLRGLRRDTERGIDETTSML